MPTTVADTKSLRLASNGLRLPVRNNFSRLFSNSRCGVDQAWRLRVAHEIPDLGLLLRHRHIVLLKKELTARDFAEPMHHGEQVIELGTDALGVGFSSARLNLAQAEVRCLLRDLRDFGYCVSVIMSAPRCAREES